jgi:hypothetical protein
MTTGDRRHHEPPPLAARFHDMGGARQAIETLQRAGVDGDDIELLGMPAQAARAQGEREVVDERAGHYIGRKLGLGLALGALVGAALGAVIGVVLLAGDGVAGGAVLVAVFALLGAALGGTVGALLNVERSVGLSEAWPLTFEDVPRGPVWVGVRGRGADNRARRVLIDLHPEEIRRAT